MQFFTTMITPSVGFLMMGCMFTYAVTQQEDKCICSLFLQPPLARGNKI